MKVLLVILIFPMLIFGQRQGMSYEEANPGVPKVYLDLRNDSTHLRSLIGKYDSSDLLKLKTFFKNPSSLKCGDIWKDSSKINFSDAEDILSNLLGRKINLCYIVASHTAYAVSSSVLGYEIIRSLISWAKDCNFLCQMEVIIKRNDDQ
jgi:hypothetical protein